MAILRSITIQMILFFIGLSGVSASIYYVVNQNTKIHTLNAALAAAEQRAVNSDAAKQLYKDAAKREAERYRQLRLKEADIRAAMGDNCTDAAMPASIASGLR